MRKLIAVLLFSAITLAAQSSGTFNSTYVKVNIGVATRAMFGFGPASNPIIGQTVVFLTCDGSTGSYSVVFNYATTSQQSSGTIPLACSVTYSKDPDGDSNQYTSVVVTSAQSGQVGGRTVTLNSASYQSEHTGPHNQNETIGGAAQITVN
jgi:hypothetical protein